jgi:integrase
MKPLTIRRGSIRVKVYCVPSGGRKRYEVRWKFGGRMRRAKRSSRVEAIGLAKLQASAVDQGRSAWLDLTDKDALDFVEERQIAAPLGKSVKALLWELRSAWEKREELVARAGTPVADLVAGFLTAKRAEGVGHYYLHDLTERLGHFAKDFKVALAGVQAEQIEEWLDGRKVGPRTWNNYLGAIRALAGHCLKRKLVPAEWDAPMRLTLRKVVYKRPAIYTPDEIRRLLLEASPALSKCIAVSAFAGLRTEEVAGIRWEDFRWQDRILHVSEEIAKTRQHSPPILDALLPWLGTIEQTGRFCPYKGAKSLSGMKVALNKRLGIPARRNALRKSWISYRLALIQNEAQVADEAGTSIGDIHRHYLNRPSLQEAQKYFGIRPNFVPQNVTQLAFAAI